MNRGWRGHASGGVTALCVAGLLTGFLPASENVRKLRPHFAPLETFSYAVRYHEAKKVKTESPVTSSDQPRDEDATAQGTLRIIVLSSTDAKGPGVTMRAEFVNPQADPQSGNRPAAGNSANAVSEKPHQVVFRLLPDGNAGDFQGLDELPTEQQRLFQQWLNLFTLYSRIPDAGVRIGEKWSADSPEQGAAPIAGLLWDRTAEYVRDEPCPVALLADAANEPAAKGKREACAVLLLHARLKQKSPPKDTTPDDYRVRNLKTSGTAQGENETIVYVSLATQLVVRVSEEAQQQMDVTIALADGSNRVRYEISANSRTDVVLLPNPNHR